MYLVVFILTLLAVIVVLQTFWQSIWSRPSRSRSAPTIPGLKPPENADPKVAVAAMLHAVASETGPVTPEKTAEIVGLLTNTIGLSPDAARTCLKEGEHLAVRFRGDLTSRLHQMRAPIERHCSPQEKQDAVEMLRTIAGRGIERVPSVREALGRIAGTLLHG